MREPTVSVIVATRDRPTRLRSALASVAAQTLLDRELIELIVVNDGGAAITGAVTTADVASEVLDDLLPGGRGGRLLVRGVQLPQARGLAGARNAGLAAADAPWVAFLDDDDLWLPTHLETLLATAQQARAPLAYANCLVLDHRTDRVAAAAGTARRTRPARLFAQPFDTAGLLVTNYIPVIAAICRNPAELGVGFDEHAAVQEDWRFWLELTADHGWRGVHVDAVTSIYHRIPADAAMTTWAGAGRAAARAGLAAFHDGAHTVWDRYPVPAGSDVARARGHVDLMYRTCAAQLDTGDPVAHYFYEDSITAILAGHRGELSESAVLTRIHAAVTGTETRGEGRATA